MTDDPKTPPKPAPDTEGGETDVSTDVSPPGVPDEAEPGGMIGEGEPHRQTERGQGERDGGMGGEG
ncbi:MAG: hypothetical protein B7Y99_09925 [Caulobacterales bacterium 32-69-10]|nr:MAG: hypothetical protein B7Y99_09925 [Caulobacterales bacterium 32-69-10]